MSFILSFQFHSACLALRDLYSGLAIMIRMPQSKPCELFLKWQVRNRKKYPSFFFLISSLRFVPLPPSLSNFLARTHRKYESNIHEVGRGSRAPICFLIQAACGGQRHPSSSCDTAECDREHDNTPPPPITATAAIQHNNCQIGCSRSDTSCASQSLPVLSLWLLLYHANFVLLITGGQ